MELQHFYDLNIIQARALVGKLNIMHPYGTIGPMHSEDKTLVPFGEDVRRVELFNLGSSIKTYHEQLVDVELEVRIRNAVSEAELVVFLGFSYYSKNMALLKADKPAKMVRVLATAMGLPKSDVSLIEQDIRGLKKAKGVSLEVTIENTSCFKLFDNYKRALISR